MYYIIKYTATGGAHVIFDHNGPRRWYCIDQAKKHAKEQAAHHQGTIYRVVKLEYSVSAQLMPVFTEY